MAVPRNRHSNARKNTKRSHHAKEEKHVSICSNCGKKCLFHRMCAFCGFYRGRAVISQGSE